MIEDFDKIDICLPDYTPNPDRDDDEMLHIKEAFSRLPYLDKKLFVQYMELGGTYTAFASAYGVTPPTAKKVIQRIRQKIYDNL